MGRKSKKTSASPPVRNDVSDASPAAPAPVKVAPRGWRLWCMRLSLAVFTPVVFFGLFEAGLRLGGYGYQADYFVRAEAKGSFISNPRFGWRFFPRLIARSPHPHILAPKPAEAIRIFVLGGSAAMGTPDASFSFGRILEVMLQEQYPGLDFEVANVAMTAINSHVVREIAKDCATHEPDLFVVYMGNNEVVGPYGPGTIFQRWSPGLPWTRASVALKATRVGQCLSEVQGSLKRKKSAPGSWEGMQMFLENPVPGDDARLEVVYENYRQNLNDILEAGRRAGAGRVLSTVAVNLQDCPPFASQHASSLTEDGLAQWDSLYAAGNVLEEDQNWDDALEQYEQAARIDDRFAELQYRMAQCLLKVNRLAEAQDRLALARDLDVLRFRADSRLNAIVHEVAKAHAASGLQLVDAEDILADGEGGDIFFEHVHFTFNGTYQLARAFFEPVCAALPQLSKVQRSGPLPTRERCAELLTLTAWDEYEIVGKIAGLTSKAPFTHQLNHDQRLLAFRQERDVLLDHASLPQTKAEVWKAYQAALVKDPDNWELHHRFSKLASAWNQPKVAIEHLQFVVDRMPDDPSKLSELGQALVADGNVDAAMAQYKKALRLFPEHVDTVNGYGAALWQIGRVDEAIVQFRKALETSPRHSSALNNLGSAYVSLGQLDAAISQYRKAIGVDPDYAEAYKNIGKVFLQKGQPSEAVDAFRKSLDLAPRDADLHYQLFQILSSLERNSEAVTHCRKALALKPNDAKIHNNFGVLLAGMGHVDEAITHYEKALALNPEYAAAHNNLGSVLFPKGEQEKGLFHFRRSVAIKPNDVDAQRNLALALKSLGKDEEALKHLRRFQALQSGGPTQNDLEAFLLAPPSSR
jgi:tetratricopeptide (TPR) repeat protein